MIHEREYEDWKSARRAAAPPEGFADRVMGGLVPSRLARWSRLARTAALVLAGAALAFRTVCTLAVLVLTG